MNLSNKLPHSRLAQSLQKSLPTFHVKKIFNDLLKCGLFTALFSLISMAVCAPLTAAQSLVVSSAISGQPISANMPVGLPRASSSTPATTGSSSAAAAVITPANSAAAATSAVPVAPVSTPTPPALIGGPNAAQAAFYLSNQSSNVFGANLFTGAFARQGATQFNPDYIVALGDGIEVRLWGSFQFDQVLSVDPEGNIYLPNIGPVKVIGIRNSEIQKAIETAINKVYRSNVLSYSNLSAAQPVRVFVGGYVNLPGMYSGTSMDSLLSYLDQAGGIDPARGSFLNVVVKRGSLTRATFNLYDFLLDGHIPLIQLADGDVILVDKIKDTFTVAGMASNAKQFEFSGSLTLDDAIKLSGPQAMANHVLVTHNDRSRSQETDYVALKDANPTPLKNGDVVTFTSDKKIGTISVRVQGEHESEIAYVLPYGSRLGDLMKNIKYSDRSAAPEIQLYRLSVQAIQKQQLQSLLQNLQTNILNARSGTAAEENLRSQEAARMLQWISYANQIQPTGQVLIANNANRDNLLLENGDIINIPVKNGLVNVNGLVSFPTSIAFNSSLKVEDYIRMCGGFVQDEDTARVIVSHLDGSFYDIAGKNVSRDNKEIREGDTIMVLPFADPKTRQFWVEMSQIISQVAITAKVVLGL